MHALSGGLEARAVAVLANCRRAVVEGGRILVIDVVLPPRNVPSPTRPFDLLMLTLFGGGGLRTEAEFRTLFAVAGVKLPQVIPTGSAITPMSIIEGVAA
jgi:hypothetical protein